VHGLEDAARQLVSTLPSCSFRLTAWHTFRVAPIRATIVTTAAGPRSHRRMPGNAWETARNFKRLAVQIRT
jgi:hypothetical protein